jgi:dUTP pyrophosphatase
VYESVVTIPEYRYIGSSGVDLHAHLPGPNNKVLLHPFQREIIFTGIEIEIPSGFEGQIRPCVDLAMQDGITILNSPGTLDSSYRGKVFVILINFGDKVVEITDNQRIARLVLTRVNKIKWEIVTGPKQTRLSNPIETVNLDSDSDSNDSFSNFYEKTKKLKQLLLDNGAVTDGEQSSDLEEVAVI